MFDNNWELINGGDAHDIEVLNQSSVANLIESLVRFLRHHDKTPGIECAICPDQGFLKELHRTGTLLLLAAPGSYRECEVYVRRRDGAIFAPPLPAEVPSHMNQLESRLKELWGETDAIGIAAYALWRINWVHPFKNGNGRTARAFAYACVCLKFGGMLPGSVTMIDLITTSRDEYEAALGHADTTFASTGEPDMGPLNAYVDQLIRKQLLSALSGAEQPALEAANA
jgi:Fic family protein